MRTNVINEIENYIHTLRGVSITNNYNDHYNLNLLMQNFMLLKQILAKNEEFTKATHLLSVMKNEMKNLLARHSK